MYGRTIYADQRLIINNQEISGITNFNGEFEIPFENIDILGGNFAATTQGEVSRNITFSRFLNQKDHLRYLTGEFFCSGVLLHKNSSFGFSRGFLTDYSVSCGIGDVATIDTSLVIYDNIGGDITYPVNPSQNTDNLYVANFGSIIIETNEGQTNRITSFNYSINCERVPLFVLGSINPAEVLLKKPIILELNLTLENDDFQSSNVQTLLCSPNIQNLNVELKNCDHSETIDTLPMPEARLISVEYAGDTESASNINMLFRSFLM